MKDLLEKFRHLEPLRKELAKHFKHLFWDTYAEKVSLPAIVERVLIYGTMDDVRYIYRKIPPEDFKEIYLILRNKKRPNLAKRTIAFWDNQLGIKDSPYYVLGK